MKKYTSLFWIAILLAALSGSCTSTTSTTDVPPSPQGSWSLAAFDLAGGRTVLVPSPERYLLELDATLDAHVRADCNFCNGSYRVSGATLEMGLLACTLAACPPGSLDGDYLRALGSASSYRAKEGELEITYAGGILRFARTAPDDADP